MATSTPKLYVMSYSLIAFLVLFAGSHTALFGRPRPITDAPASGKTNANRPPVAVASATNQTGVAPLSVTFTGSHSSDPDGDPITYLWDFGDGGSSTLANPVHVFRPTPGRFGVLILSFPVKLTVQDNQGGLTTSQTIFVSITNPAPTAQIINPVNQTSYALDRATSYTATANVTDDTPGSLIYNWELKLRHGPSYTLINTASTANPVFSVSPAGCDGDNYFYVIKLKVIDVGGLTAVDSVRLNPNCNSPKMTVTGLTATTLSSTSVRLNWTNPTQPFAEMMVVGKVGSTPYGVPFSTSYVANSSFTGNGADLFGGKVLYQGTSNSVIITNLPAGPQDYFRVYTRLANATWTNGIEVSSPANRPPTAVATAIPVQGNSPLSVSFTGSHSTDPDGDPLLYEWAFSDDTFSNEPNPVKTFAIQPARFGVGVISVYTAQLTVTDRKGQRSTSQLITIRLNDLNVTGITATTLSGSSVRLNWTNPANTFDNVLVVGKAGSGITGIPTDPLYVANPSFTGNGASLFGGKVLYQGRGTTINITELTAGQTYFFRVYTRSGSTWTTGVEVNATPVNSSDPGPGSVTAIESGKCYRLVSRVSGKVLGVEGGSVADGALVRQRTDTDQLAQRWRFESVGGGFYRIGAVHSNKTLDMLWGSTQNGMPVQQWTFNGNWSFNQHFSLFRLPDGAYQITARHSSKALEVQNGNSDEGGMVVQNTPSSSVNQQWIIEERGCTTGPPTSTTTSPPTSTTTAPPTTNIDAAKCYRIQSRSSGLALNVPGGSGNDGTTLTQNTNANQLWQKWRFTPVNGNFYQIAVLHNLKGIQVAGSSTADNALLEQWTYWGGSHQQWRVQRNQEGFFTFANRNSNRAITVQNASTTEGAYVVQQTLGTGGHQQWTVTETTCSAGARIATLEKGGTFTLGPNPAQDYVLIDLSSIAGAPVTLQLNDLTGRTFQQTQLEKAPTEPYRFNTGKTPDGLYLLQIIPDGQTPIPLRLLIQR